MGDGSTNTILNGATKGQGGYPGRSARSSTARARAMSSSGTSPSSRRALTSPASESSFARSTAAFAQFSEDNEVRNVYMELLHDATANDGNGTIGIYGLRRRNVPVRQRHHHRRSPLRLHRKRSLRGRVAESPVNNTHVGTTVNTAPAVTALGYYDSVLMQGSVHNTTLSSPSSARPPGPREARNQGPQGFDSSARGRSWTWISRGFRSRRGPESSRRRPRSSG